MKGLQSFGMLLGRIALSAVFIIPGFIKIAGWDGYVQYMTAKGMTMVPLFLGLAILIEILGGLALFFGFKTRIVAALLLLYLIPVTGIFHDFWNGDDPNKMQLFNFLKNLAIIGGLFYVTTIGAGRFSIDWCCTSKEEKHKQHPNT